MDGMTTETHEPAIPQNWPDGHVHVDLTDDSQHECLQITIHGVDHYLHASTARELSTMLLGRIEDYNVVCRQIGMPTV